MDIEGPSASVVIVIDYKVGDGNTWSDLRLTLSALAQQDYDSAVEFLLVEPAGAQPAVPADLAETLPGLRVVHVPARTSYDLKNAGCEAAASELVVILDADCVPHRGWLRAVVRHHERHPQAAAISGKTLYRRSDLLARIFALLDRGYVDCGGPGRTRAISNNNAGFRREALLRHPLSNDLGTFGSKIHSDAMLAAGEELRFEPEMIAYHAFHGWKGQRLDRRHIGFAMAKHRLLNEKATHAWMFRFGILATPVVFAMAVAGSWKRCLKRGAGYGLRWFEIPAAMAVALPVHAMELPGVVLAMRDGEIAYGEGYV